MGFFDLFRKKDRKAETKQIHTAMKNREERLDDVSYIAEMKHQTQGPWQQYDVVINARGYGWKDLCIWADYMAEADLVNISKVAKSRMIGAEPEEILDEYRQYHALQKMPSLEEEGGVLAVGGMSKCLGAPVQIIWFNQTRMLRFFTIVNDEERMNRYAETVLRRSFGTDDEMKAARPVSA